MEDKDMGRVMRLLIFIVGASLMYAQSAGSLVVSVHGAKGEAVKSALVMLNAARTETDDTGTARFADVVAGKHRLKIAARGFDELATDISTDVSVENRIDAVLNAAHTESITIQGVIDTPFAEATPSAILERQQVRNAPDRPRTVTDALPLAPGVIRLPSGQLRLSGNGEHRSAMLVNSSNASDPATGQFGATLPIDSVRTISVLTSPFLAEYGGFTSDVVAVETRKGGNKWNFEVNDPLPEFRWRSWHMVGLRSATPRVNFGGPLIKNRLYLLESGQYEMRETPVITLPFPRNETRREGYNTLTALDFTINGTNVLSAIAHVASEHARFANLDFFNPQPVSPNTADTVYSADLTETASIKGTLLTSSFSAASFRSGVWPQGLLGMTLTPTTNLGNYFSQQKRTASRLEWRETWSLTRKLLGTHNLKTGLLLGGSNEHALVSQSRVDVQNGAGRLLESIAFTVGRPIARNDIESAYFVQDQWVPHARFSLNLGIRVEQQEVTGAFRVGPRGGFVWTPLRGGRTILRGGAGLFYDRVPLNVYGFAFYPNQIITRFAADGSVVSGPDRYFNLTEPAAPHRSPLIYRKNVPGNYAPHSTNSNVELEQIVSSRVRLRARYLESNSTELIVLAPLVTDTVHAFVLNGDGNAHLRELELTVAATARKEDQMFLSYVRSSSHGNLNEFSNYLANFPPAVILPDARTFLPGDAPHRFLGWGTMALPMTMRISPKVEYRTGFPWASVDEAQNYTGVPNQVRFPSYFSVDARLTKDFKVTDKYTFRLGVSGSNLTNHFNPVSVHANTGDPAYGVFFGTYHRRYTADFDVLF